VRLWYPATGITRYAFVGAQSQRPLLANPVDRS
jgi:hypothetical protein